MNEQNNMAVLFTLSVVLINGYHIKNTAVTNAIGKHYCGKPAE